MPPALIYGTIPSPSLGAGPGSREETRGRDGQEFKLVELVGEGRSAWEWPAVRAWATGPSVRRAPGEGAANGQDSAESETPRGLGGRRQAGSAGWGGWSTQGGGPRGRTGCWGPSPGSSGFKEKRGLPEGRGPPFPEEGVVSPTRSGQIRATGPSLPRDCDQRLLPQPRGFLVCAATRELAPPPPGRKPPLPPGSSPNSLKQSKRGRWNLEAPRVPHSEQPWSTPSHWQPTGQSPPGPAPPAGIQGLPSLLLPPSAHLSPLLIERLLPAHPSRMGRDRSRPHFTGGETEADRSQLKGSGRQWPGQDLDPAPTASPWASPETGLPAFPTQSRDRAPPSTVQLTGAGRPGCSLLQTDLTTDPASLMVEATRKLGSKVRGDQECEAQARESL